MENKFVTCYENNNIYKNFQIMKNKRKTIIDIKKQKNHEPIVCLTAYSAPMAKLVDEFVDIILVGDSLGMVVYGMETTLQVTLDMMINHTKAVTKSSHKAFIVADMPFGTYEKSKEQAFENAAKLISETGCNAVKIEGGVKMQETIEFLSQRGIPVMAHIGLMPQMINSYDGYKPHGKSDEIQEKIIQDAKAVQEAGAFSVVIEAVTEDLANKITDILQIPVIGIGASNKCDGQILVVDDMLGMFTEFKPKFVKRYANLADDIKKAIEQYSSEVKARSFPQKDNIFS